jgi:hypothetical protein
MLILKIIAFLNKLVIISIFLIIFFIHTTLVDGVRNAFCLLRFCKSKLLVFIAVVIGIMGRLNDNIFGYFFILTCTSITRVKDVIRDLDTKLFEIFDYFFGGVVILISIL